MELNRLTFPRLAQYLDSLPQNLESYPSALTRSDFSLILRRHLDPFLKEGSMPQSLRAVLTAPWKPGDWIPTTTYVALCAVARDHLWLSDQDYHQGMFEVATEMYKGPVYKTLFLMLGPSIAAMGAAKRWDTLHQGTQLVIKKQTKESLCLVLTSPQNLFTDLAVQSLGAAFCAVAQGSRGRDATFEMVTRNDVEAELLISWTY
jgi:hypothetical protein